MCLALAPPGVCDHQGEHAEPCDGLDHAHRSAGGAADGATYCEDDERYAWVHAMTSCRAMTLHHGEVVSSDDSTQCGCRAHHHPPTHTPTTYRIHTPPPTQARTYRTAADMVGGTPGFLLRRRSQKFGLLVRTGWEGLMVAERGAFCPVVYDHDPDGPDCAVCGWSPAMRVRRLDPGEWRGIQAWIEALNGVCSGPDGRGRAE